MGFDKPVKIGGKKGINTDVASRWFLKNSVEALEFSYQQICQQKNRSIFGARSEKWRQSSRQRVVRNRASDFIARPAIPKDSLLAGTRRHLARK
jgi:hypothetical protein